MLGLAGRDAGILGPLLVIHFGNVNDALHVRKCLFPLGMVTDIISVRQKHVLEAAHSLCTDPVSHQLVLCYTSRPSLPL
jgi:hypothetical protein